MTALPIRQEAPSWFREELRRRFGAGHDCEWDMTLCRWVVITPSSTGKPVRQPVVWRVDPHSGLPLRADRTGLLPFRELTPETLRDILDNLERTALHNRHDGAGTWGRHVAQVVAHNEGVRQRVIQEGMDDYWTALSEVDLKRPWLKHHSGSAALRRLANGGR